MRARVLRGVPARLAAGPPLAPPTRPGGKAGTNKGTNVMVTQRLPA
ncbi:hypothetical protein [Streptomyces sp. NPDC048825]